MNNRERSNKKEHGRRQFLTVGGSAVAATMVVMGSPLETQAQGASTRRLDRKWYELNIIGDDSMDGNLLRSLEAIWHGMGDVGECLDTASRIKAGDLGSWYSEWFATAERIASIAKLSERSGHAVSAGEAYMRACNYYRAAEFYEHDNPAARSSMECFQAALPLLSIPAEPVEIPYEGTTLPGYFYRSPLAKGKAPVLIAHSGFDGTPEEMKFIAEGAIRRGYHCLMFSGPGQGLVIREQKLPFRHDWENVITPVVDFVIELPGVDADRLALLGASFGGYLAPRAVAFEHRIKACIANPGVLNWYEVATTFHGPEMRDLLLNEPDEYNAVIFKQMKENIGLFWAMSDGMLKYSADTPAEMVMAVKPYNNEPVVKQIKCAMLIMDGTEETISEGQAMKLYDALDCPKEFMLFDEKSTGSLHCQTGALAISNQRMFDWLDDQLMKA